MENSMMGTKKEQGPAGRKKLGWGLLLSLSALLAIAGISWIAMLPSMLLENIAEYANLDTALFMQGNPSAFDIITMIARGYGIGFAALGVFALVVALEGYRHGTRWAWRAMWVLVLAFAALGGSFQAAGESSALTLGIYSLAGAALIGQMLARRSPESV